MHLFYCTLFLIFQLVNLYTFFNDFEKGDDNNSFWTVSAWVVWDIVECFNRIIMLVLLEEMNEYYQEYVNQQLDDGPDFDVLYTTEPDSPNNDKLADES